MDTVKHKLVYANNSMVAYLEVVAPPIRRGMFIFRLSISLAT